MTNDQFKALATWHHWRNVIQRMFDQYQINAKRKIPDVWSNIGFIMGGKALAPFGAYASLANPAWGNIAQMDSEDMLTITVDINFIESSEARVDASIQRKATSWDMAAVIINLNVQNVFVLHNLDGALQTVHTFLFEHEAAAIKLLE